MKKYLSILAALSFGAAQSQEITDALRYAQDNLNGTARFRAMGGAFGALGGDLSSISINPAGSAVFVNNQIGISLTSYNINNKVDYFGTRATEMDYSIDLNQAGGVYVLDNDDESSSWRKLTLSLNYENTSNLDNTWFSAGVNPDNSIDEYFLSYSQGIPLGTITSPFYENLDFAGWQSLFGYEGYVINPLNDDDANIDYVSNVPAGGNYYHENSFTSSGFNGKLAFNIAAQYQDWLFIGLNLNSHFTDYRQSTSFYEQNSNNPQAGLQQLRFNNDLYTYGSGFSFQLGGIAKFNEFRVGLSYESPTWYRLEDEFSQYIAYTNVDDATESTTTNFFDPMVTLIYTYKLQTPSKWTGSLAYVFGQSGLISVDYTIKDYSSTKFRPESDFMTTNDYMSDVLDWSGELRIGAEKKIKQWSLRAGYRMDQSPYKNGRTMGDLNAVSGGIGYNFGDTKLDVSYTHSQRETENAFFSQGFTDAPEIKSVNNNVTVTLLFEL